MRKDKKKKRNVFLASLHFKLRDDTKDTKPLYIMPGDKQFVFPLSVQRRDLLLKHRRESFFAAGTTNRLTRKRSPQKSQALPNT